MKIFVCVKQVPDTETKIRLKADSSGIDETGVKWIMNPYDEYAVEEALKIKESQGNTPHITVLSVGPKNRIIDCLRTALAMGADDGIAIDAPADMDSYTAAQLIAAAIQKEEGGFHLIFTGKLAIDDNAASTGQMLAEFLGIPHASVVSKFELHNQKCVAEREVEGGSREIYELPLPCLITANKGLNHPRYATLPGIMKAKKKTIKELVGTEIMGSLTPKIKHIKFQLPEEKPPVQLITGDPDQQARELCRLLIEQAKVF